MKKYLYLIITLFTGLPVLAFAITLSTNVTVSGNAQVIGSISKGSGTFMIDHPLFPKTKLLYHSFVESPDVLNVYDGITTLDANGAITIDLPDYFLALNERFQYLLTPIGESMPNLYIAQPVFRDRAFYVLPEGKIRFSIAGGAPNGKVSWQVTGIRHDQMIQKYPIIPEVEKSDATIVKKGECLFAPLCAEKK